MRRSTQPGRSSTPFTVACVPTGMNAGSSTGAVRRVKCAQPGGEVGVGVMDLEGEAEHESVFGFRIAD